MAPIAIATPPSPFHAIDRKNLTARATVSHKSSTFHHAQPPPIAVSGSGLTFTLDDGRVILDGVSGGAAVACLGNGNDEVIEVMTEQAKKMAYAYHQSLGSGPGDELARYLCERGGFEAAAFLNSGSEAMEACIKTARQYWVEKGELERKYIIARFPSYHGNTLGALAIGNVPGRRDIYKPLFSSTAFHHVSSPTYRRSHRPHESEEAYSARLAAELDAKITELGPANVIGFFAEPVVGAALGVMPPPRGYFPAIDAVVKKHGILFVMDEVMSGTGRCGELFAHDAVCQGVRPDMIAMAKGLGAGYVTISAILVNRRVAEIVKRDGSGMWQNSHTFQNHPINCAVAKKVLEIMERDDLYSNVREKGRLLLAGLREGLKDVPIVIDVRGKGLVCLIPADETYADRFGYAVRRNRVQCSKHTGTSLRGSS